MRYQRCLVLVEGRQGDRCRIGRPRTGCITDHEDRAPELLSHITRGTAELKKIDLFLETWSVELLHQSIEDLTIELRKRHHCKLPDAMIAATASYLDIPLVTADKGLLRMNEDVEVVFYDPDQTL